MRTMERRGILKGLGAAALAAPLAQLFRMHTGRAAGAGALPKVVFFYTPCGVEPQLWHPTQTGANFTLPRMSAPLAPYQSECIFMDGISMYPLTDHQGGSQQMLAGDEQDVETIDIQLGKFLNMGSSPPPIQMLELGIQSRISKGGTPTVPHPHFTRHSLAQEVFAEDNPLAAFAATFGQIAMGMGPTATTSPAATLQALQQKSVLDTATQDLKSLQAKLPNSEKNKIDAYATSLVNLQRSLTAPISTSASCNDFSHFNPTGFAVPQVGDPNQASYNQTQYMGVVADMQMEIARLALACGRTRVITILFGHTNAHNPISGLGPFGVHDASHYNAPPGQLTGNATQAQKDAKLAAWENYRVWYAQKLAQFIGMLKATPDVTGTLFDNTILMHCSELGNGGPHKTDRIPYVFAGGSALGFKLGQAINFTGSVPAFSGASHAGIANLAHSPLLTLVCNKMGMPIPAPFTTQFGYSGPQAVDFKTLGIV
jgi:hypothetical protein